MKHTNHALANAMTKAEANKTRTVPKGTLSLAGNQNKRSTDVSAQNLPAPADATLVEAAQMLHDTATKGIEMATTQNTEQAAKPSNVVALGDIPAVVPRIDLLKNQVFFLVNTQIPETGEIQYYNLKDGTLNTATVEYYRSTKQVDKEEVLSKMVNQFMTKTGSQSIILRKRLIKGHVLERDEDGKVDEKSIDQLKQNLLKAVEQFRAAILAA